MPKLGMTMEEGTVTTWLKQEGDEVKRGEEIVEIETDKVTMKLEAPASGILYKILVAEKQVVPVGTTIALITAPGEEVSEIESYIEVKTQSAPVIPSPSVTQKTEVKEEAMGRIFISPRALKLTKEKNVDYTHIRGTGPEGRIIEKDIINYLDQGTPVKIESKSIPLEGIRKIIAKKMSSSLSEIPQLTYTSEVDMTESMRLREYFLNLYKNKANIKVSLTDIIIKVVIEVIKRMPIFNATLDGDIIKISEQINLGVAVATDKGLIVPVIHNANEKSLEEISETVRSLAEKARSSTLSLDEITGGTFTVSNLGMFGIEVFTPIINPPEAAILGIGKTIQKPAVKENRIEICPMMILSLTHDHRIMDGVDAAKFLQNMKTFLEDPYPLFNVSPDLLKGKVAIVSKPIIQPSKPAAEKPVTDKAAVRFVEMMKKRGHSILGHEPAQMDLIGAHNPQIIADFVRLHRDGLSEGVLPSKIKALMALSIAVVVGCESCMKWHLVEAVEAGATDEEISETLAITVFMGGGPALMHSETVADYLKTLRK